MPTYDYRCGACQHEFEEFQSITAKPLKKCPACGKSALVRLIGTGAGVLFKGDGFYQTDYRSESYRKAAEAEKPKNSSDGATKSDASAKSDGAASAASGKNGTAAASAAKEGGTTPAASTESKRKGKPA